MVVSFILQFIIMTKPEKKFKVLNEWLWIDLYSLDNALFEQNLLVERLREENKTLKWNVEFLHRCLDDREGSLELMKEENERLENEINNSKSIWNIIANCVILSFFCFLFAWVLCIWFMMIADAIMWFKFVVFL